MKKVYIFLLLILICFSLSLFYINIKEPIKIAIIGDFQGERYDFVTNSVITGRVAEHDINNAQGVRGRSIQIVMKDDTFYDPDATIKFLIDNKIEAIITTANSEKIVKLKPYLDKNKIVCMCVGATSSELNNQNDYIYRLLPDDGMEVDTLFKYMNTNNINKDFCIIYNETNKNFKDSIRNNIISKGGKVSLEEAFGNDSASYSPSSDIILSNKSILVLASARDTAFIIQKLSEKGINKNTFGLSWSGDKNLINYGGRIAENFVFVSPAPLSYNLDGYGELTKKLQEYKKDNGLIPYGVYQAFIILQKGYEQKYDKHLNLKEAIDSIGIFPGLSGKLLMNKDGDIDANEYVFTVKDGDFIKIGGSSYENTEN